jgi:hypothetical protein
LNESLGGFGMCNAPCGNYTISARKCRHGAGHSFQNRTVPKLGRITELLKSKGTIHHKVGWKWASTGRAVLAARHIHDAKPLRPQFSPALGPFLCRLGFVVWNQLARIRYQPIAQAHSGF